VADARRTHQGTQLREALPTERLYPLVAHLAEGLGPWAFPFGVALGVSASALDRCPRHLRRGEGRADVQVVGPIGLRPL